MTARTGRHFALYAELDGTPESARDARTLVRHETAEPDSVTIQVRDSGGFTTPRVQGADANAEHGRGLAIVSALAAEWGSRLSHAGRVTWCRFVLRVLPTSAPPLALA